MKFFLLNFFCVFILSGCASRIVQTSAIQPAEDLIGFYSTAPQGRGEVYIIGSRREYRLNENPALIEFLLSDNARYAVHSDAEIRIYPGSRHEAFFNYRFYLDAQKSNPAELARIKKYKNISISAPHTADAGLAAQIGLKIPGWQENRPLITVRLAGGGHAVALERRSALLAKHTLKKPIPARVSYEYRNKKIDMKESLRQAALIPAAVVMIPLMTAACMQRGGFSDTCLFY